MLQYRGKNAISKFKNDNQEKTGQSLCSILGCCSGVDLECWGCHPGLLAMGMPCEEQPTETNSPLRRDCFCDASCILFEDCCDDHFGACAAFYDVWGSKNYFHQKNNYFRNQKAVFGQKIQ